MNSIFIGTVRFSGLILEKLVDLGQAPLGVVTKKMSAYNSDFLSLTPICEKYDIPYRLVTDIHEPDVIDWIKLKRPEVIFCFGWSSLIKKSILEIPSMGVIGFHPAALPCNRGRHPLVWALSLGLEQTASTFFLWMKALIQVISLARKKYLSSTKMMPSPCMQR